MPPVKHQLENLWSAAREKRLHASAEWLVYGCLAVLGGAAAFVRPWSAALVVSIIATVLTVWSLLRVSTKWERMMANRPRAGASGMTEWIEHPSDNKYFDCVCGSQFNWNRAHDTGPYHPSPRLVIHCVCGAAHFKLAHDAKGMTVSQHLKWRDKTDHERQLREQAEEDKADAS